MVTRVQTGALPVASTYELTIMHLCRDYALCLCHHSTQSDDMDVLDSDDTEMVLHTRAIPRILVLYAYTCNPTHTRSIPNLLCSIVQ